MRKGVQKDAVQGVTSYRPECIKYAKFYLEQFFSYLSIALQNEHLQGNGFSGTMNTFTSNEDKVKEMWEKLCYSLTKSETCEMISLVQYIFCTLSAF